MRNLELVLARVAALALALPACTNADSENSCPSNGATIQVPQDLACTIARSNPYAFTGPGAHSIFGGVCGDVCRDAGPYGVCILPGNYALTLADGGPLTIADLEYSDGDAGPLACPSSGSVAIQCAVDCTGRRTAGIADVIATGHRDAGEYFAASAYLENVSALAFARLARELAAHGAPPDLVEACKRAEAEEIVHAELTTALASAHGATASVPHSDGDAMRSLFDVAMENAVEGCVRETYGAALALVRAKRARDPHVRNALEVIARDECHHAAISWDIAAWASEQLSTKQREEIAREMRRARAELQQSVDALSDDARSLVGMPPIAEQRRLAVLLEAHVFVPRANGMSAS